MTNNHQLKNDYDFKKVFIKYYNYRKYFIVSFISFLTLAFLYLRNTDQVFNTSAKIKIIDSEQKLLEAPSFEEILENKKVNLVNEIEILKSFPILKKVVINTNSFMQVLKVGYFKNSFSLDYPFSIKSKFSAETISNYITENPDLGELVYKVKLVEGQLEILNIQTQKKYTFNNYNTYETKHDLPFEIKNINIEKWSEKGFYVKYKTIDDMVFSLKNKIRIFQVGKDSEILQIEYNSANIKHARNMINELISVFNEDGINDRRLVHKRTIEFVNERFKFLTQELDSIELKKKFFKQENNLIDISTNSELSLEKSLTSEQNIFDLENQITVINLLKQSLNENVESLLPSNIGVENNEINSLISNFNKTIIERNKLLLSAGKNNPKVKQLNSIITSSSSNIILSLINQEIRLKKIKEKLVQQFKRYDNVVYNIPVQEKTLREIERNQKIQETLYLLLLEKREEAEVGYAITEPSLKVVEFPLSNKKPLYPIKVFVYFFSIILAILCPVLILSLLFKLNNKIYSREQFDSLNLPFPLIAEIPKVNDNEKLDITSDYNRSILAESFRILASNLKFFMEKDKCQVVYVTSTIKGEGKTFVSLNLAHTISSTNNKVLLVGADLHNPQIHSYLNIEKHKKGLTDFLVDKKNDWKKLLVKPNSNLNFDVLLAGSIPPNPVQLLNNGNLNLLIKEAEKKYDYIVFDTPPCLLVSDTFSIAKIADLFLFVVRCNHTKTDVLDFIKDSHNKGLLKSNSMFVLNGLETDKKIKYGYSDKYNYGYGYGYASD